MTILIATLFSTLVFAAPAKKLTITELLATSQPADWRTPDPDNLLYMDVPSGQVVIELAPEYAPKTVARIKDLARQKYWDGLAVVRVQENYVVQWADPNANDKPELKKKFKGSEVKLPIELDIALDGKIPFQPLPDKDTYASETGFTNGFAAARDKKAKRTWLLHCYGAVGVGRENAPDSGDGSELYAVIGHAPRGLDRNVTVVGRILRGTEYLSSLPRGHGAMGFYDKDKKEKPVSISAIHLGSEVPDKERVNIEVLRTDTPLFKQLIEARRTRVEEWFVFRSGKIEACGFSIPVRDKK